VFRRTLTTIKRRACGFRNREHFRTAILYNCGVLQLYPVTHGEA
jgi:transposase